MDSCEEKMAVLRALKRRRKFLHVSYLLLGGILILLVNIIVCIAEILRYIDETDAIAPTVPPRPMAENGQVGHPCCPAEHGPQKPPTPRPRGDEVHVESRITRDIFTQVDDRMLDNSQFRIYSNQLTDERDPSSSDSTEDDDFDNFFSAANAQYGNIYRHRSLETIEEVEERQDSSSISSNPSTSEANGRRRRHLKRTSRENLSSTEETSQKSETLSRSTTTADTSDGTGTHGDETDEDVDNSELIDTELLSSVTPANNSSGSGDATRLQSNPPSLGSSTGAMSVPASPEITPVLIRNQTLRALSETVTESAPGASSQGNSTDQQTYCSTATIHSRRVFVIDTGSSMTDLVADILYFEQDTSSSLSSVTPSSSTGNVSEPDDRTATSTPETIINTADESFLSD